MHPFFDHRQFDVDCFRERLHLLCKRLYTRGHRIDALVQLRKLVVKRQVYLDFATQQFAEVVLQLGDFFIQVMAVAALDMELRDGNLARDTNSGVFLSDFG